MGLSLSIAFWVSTVEWFLINKQRTKPEAVKKCWQQKASRGTTCQSHYINKNIKHPKLLHNEKWRVEEGLLEDRGKEKKVKEGTEVFVHINKNRRIIKTMGEETIKDEWR